MIAPVLPPAVPLVPEGGPAVVRPRPRPVLAAERLRLFVATDHDAHGLGRGASVIVAADPAEARALLDAALVARGLAPHDREPYTLRELPLDRAFAEVLDDGTN